jgi:glycosyltransferase involved in cell wall biosynthesis
MVLHGPYPVGEGRVANEARAALEAGWEVDVVAMRRPGEPAEEVVDGAAVFRLPLSHRWGGGAIETAREYLGFTALATAKVAGLMKRRRYAVVQVHNPPDFLIVAALVPRLLGARVLLDIHDFAPELFAMRFGSRPGFGVANAAMVGAERLAMRLAGAIVTVHEPYRRALEARGVPPKKITVVLNSLDERLVPAAAPSTVEASDFRVVYHGTITPFWGVELLVEAAAQIVADVPELRLEIYGDGDALPRVRARIDELDLADRVYLSGRFLPQPEVLARVHGASAGVICNLPEERNQAAMPTKLFEYARLGVPIVSADLAAIREHFSPQEVRFFEAGSADKLAEALREMAAHPEAARARAQAARRRYEAYAWPVSARRYLELLERVTAGSSGPTRSWARFSRTRRGR